jgi:DNA-binding FrmR family transcriptional regulator
MMRGTGVAEQKGAEHGGQLARISRIEGQVRGIKKMIEDGRYCVEILTQLKAIKSALTSVEMNIVEAHLNHCVNRALLSKDEKVTKETIREIKALLKSMGT